MLLQIAAGKLYGKSLWFYKLSMGLILVLYALTIISFVVHGPVGDAVLLVLILGLQVAQTIIKYRAVTWYGRGETARRMDQLEEGLGTVPKALAVQRIRSWVGLCEGTRDSTYWYTNAPVGPRRLVEMIEEASFYTMTYADACWQYFCGFAVVGSILCVVFMTIAVRVGMNTEKDEFWSHVVVASLSVFLAGDIVAMALQYRDLANAAREALQAASDSANCDVVELERSLEVAMEYNSALAQAPPLPNFLHQKRRDLLGTQWSAYVADQTRTMET